MRKLICPILFTGIWILSSCGGHETPPRSQEFIVDSTFVAKYDPWFDTICASLPTNETVEKIICPDGCFDGLDLFNEENPFPVFEPIEMRRDTTVASYFRYQKVQGPVDVGRPYFDWDYDAGRAPDLHWHAEQIRKLISWQFFCVFIVDSSKYIQPQIDSSGEHFTPGKIGGYAVMVDFTTGKSICAFKVKAESSAEITYNTYLSDDPQLAAAFESGPRIGLEVDLRLNLVTQIQNRLFDSRTSVKNNPSTIIHDPIYK